MGIGDNEAEQVREMGVQVLEVLLAGQTDEGDSPNLSPKMSIQVLIHVAAAIIEAGHPDADMAELSAAAEGVGDDLRELTELFRKNFEATGERGIEWFGGMLAGDSVTRN